MKLSEAAARVIELSTIIKHEVEAEDVKHPLGRLYDPFREKLQPTQAENDLRDFLFAQPVAYLYTLVLVMYAGRGDFPIEDFMTQYEEMTDLFDKPERAIGQMLEKVPLPDYLTEGLQGLANQGIDIDTLL